MFDPDLERVINHRRYMNFYGSTIWTYENNPESWEVLQRHHTTLANDLAQLTLTIESLQSGRCYKSIYSSSHSAKGFKTQEPKHWGHKWLKSTLEHRKKSRVGHKNIVATISQPVARHLHLENDLEVHSHTLCFDLILHTHEDKIKNKKLFLPKYRVMKRSIPKVDGLEAYRTFRIISCTV